MHNILNNPYLTLNPYLKTKHGVIYNADALEFMAQLPDGCVNLVMTSPPFALQSEKEYGNEKGDSFIEWFKAFAAQFKRIIKENGSLVLDFGASWEPKVPVRNLYQFKILLMLCEEYGFHLAQDFYWWNCSRIPGPTPWTCIRRIRVKDQINTIWWLSPSQWPKASNKRVMQPYAESTTNILAAGKNLNSKVRSSPSGHGVSKSLRSKNNGGGVPSNLLIVANNGSGSDGEYLRYCQENNLKMHPARFSAIIPEFFIRMTTDPGDFVYDPFGGSCATGEVCERLERKWATTELLEDYLKGAVSRFNKPIISPSISNIGESQSLKIQKLNLLWDTLSDEPLKEDGGKNWVKGDTIEINPEEEFEPLGEFFT